MISWEFLCCHSSDFYSFNNNSKETRISTRRNSSNFGQYLKSDGLCIQIEDHIIEFKKRIETRIGQNIPIFPNQNQQR